MSWKDKLQKASFRGVAFKVRGHTTDGGRRVVKHEFPLREKPYIEDMGRKAQAFSIDVYVLGDDYFSQRDALIRALEESGSGALVHPYLGTKQVHCEAWSMSESSDEGRIARFSLSFVESGENISPSVASDGIAEADSLANLGKEASLDEFEDAFSVDAMPGFAITDATNMFNEIADSIKDVAGTINSIASGKTGFLSDIVAFKSSLTNLLNSPRSLANSVFGLYGTLTSLFDTPLAALKSLQKMGSPKRIKIPATTDTRAKQLRNQRAISALASQAIAFESSRIAPRAIYSTAREAKDIRDSLAARLDSIMDEESTSDKVFSSAITIRANVVKSVPPPNAALKNIVDYVPPITLPSLVIAQELYQDASREAEIISRNAIAYPGFIRGGEALKVVADA